MLKALPLSTLLRYRHPAVVARYKKDFPNTKLSAEQAFEELKKFFWIRSKHVHDRTAFPDDDRLSFRDWMHVEMKEIDDMWHTFLLFTEDYADFCNKYFNCFFHHKPTSDYEHAIALGNIEETRFDEERKQLNYVYEHLGEDTLRLWFSQYLENKDI